MSYVRLMIKVLNNISTAMALTLYAKTTIMTFIILQAKIESYRIIRVQYMGLIFTGFITWICTCRSTSRIMEFQQARIYFKLQLLQGGEIKFG